jgi:hypothetical protein
MEDLSRRGFLKVARNGIAAAGLVAVAPTALAATAGAAIKPKAAQREATVRPVASSENLVVHIPNPRTGEIHFMVGTREVVRHDRALTVL